MALLARPATRDWYVRSNSAEAVGKLGDIAAPTLPALANGLEDKHLCVRYSAAEASSNSETQQHHGASIGEALEVKDDSVRKYVAEVLAKLGNAPTPAIPVLAKL